MSQCTRLARSDGSSRGSGSREIRGGMVVGMALLFAVLVIRRGVPPTLGATAGGLLEHFSLLFVPAGVGVIVHLPLIRSEWPAITVAVIASTILAMAVTALLMRWLVKASS